MKKIAVILCIIFFSMFIVSCDSGLLIVDVKITNYPNKIAYIAGKDTELDLSGLEIMIITKENTNSIKKFDDYNNAEDRHFFPEVLADINFNKAGVYIVTVKQHESAYATFPVEVIDPAK